MLSEITLGIIGTGQLGRAMAQGLLMGGLPGSNLWLANRSGTTVTLEGGAAVTQTTDLAALGAACDVVLLAVPPAVVPALSLDLSDRLVLSVVAGLTLDGMRHATGAHRVIRAMSSPAAEQRLAYTPWVAGGAVTAGDRALATGIFSAIGTTDEIAEEAHINDFTALTGPVPGFVAYFADSMIRHATAQGIPEEIATRAIRQLFLASGEMLKEGPTPARQVQEMVDYAGTTAAGLTHLRRGGFDAALSEALLAATEKARTI
ncbi:NAD(P)-binding domain-containing protein [Ferrimonas balearica]|nr:NAD(P)-binding domain-containing protein [Ferrimonas balearica]